MQLLALGLLRKWLGAQPAASRLFGAVGKLDWLYVRRQPAEPIYNLSFT